MISTGHQWIPQSNPRIGHNGKPVSWHNNMLPTSFLEDGMHFGQKIKALKKKSLAVRQQIFNWRCYPANAGIFSTSSLLSSYVTSAWQTGTWGSPFHGEPTFWESSPWHEVQICGLVASLQWASFHPFEPQSCSNVLTVVLSLSQATFP